MKRQKKLRLSGSLCRVFRLPCVKGAPPQAVRDCFFFTTLQPLRGFRTRLGDACKRASHTRKSSNRCAVSEPLSARPASVLRTLANPSNRCAVSEPLSARPASVLRTLANPFTQGSLFINCAFLRSSLLSLISKSPPVGRAFCFFILRLLWFLQQAFLREFLRISLKQPHSL